MGLCPLCYMSPPPKKKSHKEKKGKWKVMPKWLNHQSSCTHNPIRSTVAYVPKFKSLISWLCTAVAHTVIESEWSVFRMVIYWPLTVA